jgi:hypothetical protein
MPKLKHTALITLCAFVLAIPVQAERPAFSLLGKENGNVREFFSWNKDNRFVIRIHVWGDISLSGIHYVPDNSTLLDVVGYAGGPTGLLAGSKITINRFSNTKDRKPEELEIQIDGKRMVSETKFRNYPVQDGDVIYLESPPKADNFMRNLAIISTVLGIISTSATLFILARQ